MTAVIKLPINIFIAKFDKFMNHLLTAPSSVNSKLPTNIISNFLSLSCYSTIYNFYSDYSHSETKAEPKLLFMSV